MLSYAHYNYAGAGNVYEPPVSMKTAGFTPAASMTRSAAVQQQQQQLAADGGGDSSSTGGGVSQRNAYGADLSNKVLVTLSSEDRDERIYPNAAQCKLALPEPFESVSKIVMTSAEIPGTEYNVLKPKLFFSELHEGQWVPFVASMSSGNYSISDFVDGLAASLTSAVALTSEFAAVRNTYSTSYSGSWGRVAISSNQVCPFTLQFRTDDVRVQAAKVSATSQYITVSIADSQTQPLSEGAGVTFAPGNGVATLACVVNSVDTANSTVDLRVVPSIIGSTYTPSNAETGQSSTGQVITPKYKSIFSTFGTNTPGAPISVSTTSTLVPYSTQRDGTNNLGDLFGFGVLQDRTSAGIGTSKITALQSPFNKADGSIIVTTEFPHFASRGDVIRINGTSTMLDTIHQVKDTLDETHLQLQPSMQEFLNSMPQLIIYLNGENSTPTTFDIVESVELVDSNSGAAELKLKLKDKSANYNMTTFADKKIVFAVDGITNTYKQEWTYASANSGIVTTTGNSAYPDKMQLFLNYPVFLLSIQGATMTRVANAELTEFLQTGTYYSRCLISPSRFDFSRRHRYVYIELTLDTKTVGNMLIGSLPGKRLFAKIPLISGRDAVTFMTRQSIEGCVVLSTPVSTVREVNITIYNPDGSIYTFQGAEFSVTLEFYCLRPTQD